MSKAEEALDDFLVQLKDKSTPDEWTAIDKIRQALAERDQLRDYIKELEEDRQAVFEEMAKRGKKIKQLREAAEQIVVHFNLGTLKGQPKALVACGDLSALLDTIKEAGE